MKTAYDLLITAPDEQVTRCKLAYKAIVSGDWSEQANELSNYCERMAK